ncbi:MAG TPA: sigma-70 family RNA polymerase sigma factor, partial [Candidatus Acidoferrum sp.]|nr:sigma-70 family RNA polymerase sigma factor [Candidatus Acidoferrum sp.]
MNQKARFEAVYESTRQSVYAYLYRTLGDKALAEDLFQETYIRFFRAEVSGLDDAKCRAYLFRIAANLINDHFRREKRKKQMVEEISADSMELSGEQTCNEGVVSALNKLSVQNRNLLWLAYVERFDHVRIGEMLGVGPKSVKVLLYRAKQKLAALIEGSGSKKGT